jgi:hypothetical protein
VWTLLHERIDLLATSCAELAATHPAAPEAVRETAVKAAAIAATLTAHH